MVLIQLYIVNHTQVNTNFSGLLSKSYVYLIYTFWTYLLSLTCTIFTQYLIIIKYRTYWQFIRPSSPYTKSFWVYLLTPNYLLQNWRWTLLYPETNVSQSLSLLDVLPFGQRTDPHKTCHRLCNTVMFKDSCKYNEFALNTKWWRITFCK